MADPNDEHHERSVFNSVEDAVIADSYSENGVVALQGFRSSRPGIGLKAVNYLCDAAKNGLIFDSL